ncbi:hypothetical protein FOA43_000414 [Brettanomyces nanus]|uniref:Uncharacterized protein n=1 Tax=Eeniella nana TaxID=13502 RepID=A0A875RZM7_EENNA|nr:uncharacterized protein FOA43_000414 [Brettanomyces nanus]QPG73109.1 hypothetical protein FOA43_000414 [Brettanomyces nanus]
MDPFEARIYFAKQLVALTPSKVAAQELIRFLIHYSGIQNDLYPAVLETLHKVDLNYRINILQFLNDLISTLVLDPKHFSTISPAYGYVRLTVNQLPSILAQVLPRKPDPDSIVSMDPKQLEEMRCLTNLRASYSILIDISKLLQFPDLETYVDQFDATLLTQTDVQSIKQDKTFDEAYIYETVANRKPIDQPELVPLLHQEKMFIEPLTDSWKFILAKKRQSQYERVMIDTHPGRLKDSDFLSTISTVPSDHRNPLLLSQKQILQRMEADRERQKKGKETLWRVRRPTNEVSMPEFQHIWHSLDKYDLKADRALLDELNGLYNVCKTPDVSDSSAHHRRHLPPNHRPRGGRRGGANSNVVSRHRAE